MTSLILNQCILASARTEQIKNKWSQFFLQTWTFWGSSSLREKRQASQTNGCWDTWRGETQPGAFQWEFDDVCAKRGMGQKWCWFMLTRSTSLGYNLTLINLK